MIDLNKALTAQQRMDIATAYGKQGDTKTSILMYESVLDVEPNHLEAMTNCATLYRQQKQLAIADSYVERALTVDMAFAPAIAVGAQIKQDLGAYGQAQVLFESALAIKTDQNTWMNLGYLLQLIGNHTKALEAYTSARDMDRANLDVRFQRSLTAMTGAKTQDEWDDALSEYDLRNALYKSICPLPGGRPLWDGKTWPVRLLICAEQGIGDCVMMSRYARELTSWLHNTKEWGSVSLMCPKPWHGLMSRVLGPDEITPAFASIIAPDDPLPTYDSHVPMMSLLRKTGYPTARADNSPYMSSTARSIMTLWQDKFNIGLVWQGSRSHLNDPQRSICCDRFSSALEHLRGTEVEFYSLQQPEETQWAPAWVNNCEIDTLDRLADAIAQMDLVITVDSAPLHIAGAMGVKTFALIPGNPDFRWSVSGDTTEWYPSVRLFRATEPKRWQPALQAVATALAEELKNWRLKR